jgi:DNA-binding MarR family transcriptional regulator
MMSQRSLFFEVASEFDLAPAQMRRAQALEPGKPRPMSELAGALRCDNSNVTGIVDRLEDRGLVQRSPATATAGSRCSRSRRRRGAAQAAARPAQRPPEALAGPQRGDARTLRDVLARALDGIETRLRVCG